MKDLKVVSTACSKAYSVLPRSSQKFVNGVQELSRALHMNLSFPTIIAVGMLIQMTAFSLLPRYVAASPVVLFLIYKVLYANPKRIADNWYLKGARLGRHSAQIPNTDGSMPEKSGANGVVCFILGAQTNHPLGDFAPGFKTVGEFFMKGFREAEKNPEKWGLLGQTPSLKNPGPDRGNFSLNLSYWRSLDHLRAFAAAPPHVDAIIWWNKTRKQWPHIGIFHETYVCPPGHYETIYDNMHPFGMGLIGKGKEEGSGRALQKADGKAWRSMDVRMGREL